ncbi:MAG TPA: tetratricopeptide repeat protein [Acidobacteriota bacterium]|jgi:DNA-binding winged helix-turn-helix (wHTH) protein/TolB-like protein/cytochrome c-type biogenesis protein CcmH/NrfG
MTTVLVRSYEFDPFRIDLTKRVLLREGCLVALPPKAFDLLEVLVQNSGRLMSKDDLMQTVWPDTFVEEGNLTHNISLLRKALGERPGDHRYVVTVPGRGYRFVADVRPVQQNQNGGPHFMEGRTEIQMIEQHSRSQIIVEERYQNGEEQRWSNSENSNQAVINPHWDPTAATAVGQSLPTRSGPSIEQGRRPAVIATVAALIFLSIASTVYFVFWKQKSVSTGALGSSRTLAILPLRNLRPDPETDFLGFSLADSIATRLSGSAGVVVRPSSYMDKFRNRTVDPRDAARDLNVDTVLTGSFLKDAKDLRVTVQLIDMQGSRTLWQDTIEVKYENLLSIQDRIAGRVAAGLTVDGNLKPAAQPAATQDAEAYEAYLKGRYFWNRRTVPAFQKAVDYFQQAVKRDPRYARAYAGLADCYLLQAEHEKAAAAARQALLIDETLAEAHTSLANLSLFHDWNWPEARREFQRAIALDPNYPTAHHWYAYYWAAMGNLTEAISEMRRARQLDPLSLIINTDLGQLLFFARRNDEAIEQLRRTLDMDSSFVMAHYRLAEAYEQTGRYQEADMELGGVQGSASSCHLSAVLGRREQAIRCLGRLPVRTAYFKALTYSALGEKDQAFQYLYEAYRGHEGDMVLLKADPNADSLRSDPRYMDLLLRMKLPR